MKIIASMALAVVITLPSCTTRESNQASFSGISEISLTLLPDSGAQGRKSYLKFTLLRDGTAIKRDLLESKTFTGIIRTQTFEAISAIYRASNSARSSKSGYKRVGIPSKQLRIVEADRSSSFLVTDDKSDPMSETADNIEKALSGVAWTPLLFTESL